MILGNLVTRFTADLTDLQKGVAQYGTEIGKAEDASEDLTSNLGMLATKATAVAAAIIAVTYATYRAVQGAGQMADEIQDLGYQTGLSTDKIQKLQYAATLSNDNFGTIATGINQLSLSIADAADRTTTAGKAFSTLGIDPTGKSVDKVFDEVTVALSQMEDQTRRNQIAQELFGRSWKEMLPYMEDYLANIKEIEGHQILSKDDLKTLEEGKRIIDRITSAVSLWGSKALVFAEKVEIAALEGTELRKQETATQTRNLTPQQEMALMERVGGPLTTQSQFKEDPFKNMTASAAELENLEKYVIPGLESKLKRLQESGADESDIAAASLAVLNARQQLKDTELDQQEKINSAQEDYYDVAKKINDLQGKQNLTTKEYLMDMQAAGGDVASQRSLTLGYKKSLLRSDTERQDLMGDLSTAGARAIAIQRGDTATGDFVMNIDNVNLSKDYPVDKFIKDYEAYAAQQRRQAGVRT